MKLNKLNKHPQQMKICVTPQLKWAMHTEDLALADSTDHIETNEKIALALTFAIAWDFLQVMGSFHGKP